MTDENPIKRSQTKGPFRTHDEQGRQLVQVSFPASYRTYCYAAPQGLTLAVGDLVRTPPNDYNPEGSTALVRRLGSEYAGDLAELTGKAGRRARPGDAARRPYGTENRRAAPTLDRSGLPFSGPEGGHVDRQDSIDYSGPGVGEAPGAGDVVNNFPDRSRYEHDD